MKTLTARFLTLFGNRNQARSAKVPLLNLNRARSAKVPLLIALVATAMVFTFAACQPEPDPGKDKGNLQLPAELQNTRAIGIMFNMDDDDLFVLNFSPSEVKVTVRLYSNPAGNVEKLYPLKDSKTEGNKTTLYFSDNKEQDYIVYQNENGLIVIIEVNLGDLPKTGLWIWKENYRGGDNGMYGDFEYSYGATTVTITGYTGNRGDVTIPSTIDGKPVIYIEGKVFTLGHYDENPPPMHVTIPNSVRYIGESAFWNNGLTNVTIGNNVRYIGKRAFEYNRLTSVTIPDSVIYIGDYAFEGSTPNFRLTSVTIGNSVTYIGDGAFGSNDLTSVTIPNSVIYLSGFDGNKLTSITIPNSVTSIGDGAFESNNLSSVTIPDSVRSIGARAFRWNSLTSVTIGNSVTSIGAQAFESTGGIGGITWGNNNLISVTIPDSVRSIGYGAFGGNPLTSVTIGANVTLDTSAFFSNGFETAYNTTYSKAKGTYKRTNASDTNWTKQ
jgi:hypothetical protein